MKDGLEEDRGRFQSVPVGGYRPCRPGQKEPELARGDREGCGVLPDPILLVGPQHFSPSPLGGP